MYRLGMGDDPEAVLRNAIAQAKERFGKAEIASVILLAATAYLIFRYSRKR